MLLLNCHIAVPHYRGVSVFWLCRLSKQCNRRNRGSPRFCTTGVKTCRLVHRIFICGADSPPSFLLKPLPGPSLHSLIPYLPPHLSLSLLSQTPSLPFNRGLGIIPCKNFRLCRYSWVLARFLNKRQHFNPPGFIPVNFSNSFWSVELEIHQVGEIAQWTVG